jgi:hypothetical protein
VTAYLEVEGATHNDVGVRAAGEIANWLRARLADQPADDACSPGPGPFTAHYSEAVCVRLDALGAATGTTREDIVRSGVRIFDATADAGQATPQTDMPTNDGPCAVTLTWSAEDAAMVRATAAAWGVGSDELHHAGGRLVLAIVHWLAIHGT